MSSPSIEQQNTINLLCKILSIEKIVPKSDQEARFVIDDLRHKERVMKRSKH